MLECGIFERTAVAWELYRQLVPIAGEVWEKYVAEVSRTAQVKERVKQVHPAAPYLFAAGLEAHITLIVMCNSFFFVKAQREPL